MEPRTGILRTEAEKAATRALYEQVFPEDSGRFLDFYYRERCKENRIAVAEEEGKILCMAHLNPYQMQVCGKVAEVFHLYAVATSPERRGEGLMRRVLEEAFRELRQAGCPFCFLIPVRESIYEPFGFERICSHSEGAEDAGLSSEELEKRYDIFCLRDERYRRLREEEGRLPKESGELGGELPENPVVMMKIIDAERFSELSGLSRDCSEQEMLEWLRQKRIFISEEI